MKEIQKILAEKYFVPEDVEIMMRMWENLPMTNEMISAQYEQTCDCAEFQRRIGITIDSQDLYELGYRKCPYCDKEFEKAV